MHIDCVTQKNKLAGRQKIQFGEQNYEKMKWDKFSKHYFAHVIH